MKHKDSCIPAIEGGSSSIAFAFYQAGEPISRKTVRPSARPFANSTGRSACISIGYGGPCRWATAAGPG